MEIRYVYKDFYLAIEMTLQKGDFIEVEFTGRIKGGEIFDSNIKKDLINLNPKAEAKPFIFCIGQGMFLKGVEDFLIDKELGTFEIDLKPENAFGVRNSNLIQRVPSKVFQEQKLNPFPGATFNFDGKMGKVLAVSGGRITVDFNNPLAGKEVSYKINILRKVEDIKEKITSFIDFLFRKPLKFEIKEKKLVIEAEQGMKQFVELFKDKFKEVFSLELEVKEIKEENKAPKSTQ